MFSPTINLYAKSAMRSVEVELIYDNASFPDGFTVSLMMDPNGTASSCSDPTVLTKIRDSCTTSKSTNHHVKCENLQPGPYCTRAHELLPGGTLGRVFITNMTRLEENSNTAPITLPASLSADEDGLGTGKLVSIGLGIGCSIVALILLGLLFIRKREGQRPLPIGSNNNEPRHKMNLIDAVGTKPTVRVYLMYYPDCCHHVEFVEYLAKFLGYNNCEVSYDQKEINSIAVNAASWIQRKLSGQYKILVINSKGGFEQQKLWLDNAKVMIQDSISSDANMFLVALAIISHHAQRAFDYCTVYMLRPLYVSKGHLLHNICPGKYYDTPTDLDHLVCHLHDLDPQDVRLNAYPSDMWSHCASAYDDLLRQARIVAGADAPTESSRLAGICHACVSAVNSSSSSALDNIGNGPSERLLVT